MKRTRATPTYIFDYPELLPELQREMALCLDPGTAVSFGMTSQATRKLVHTLPPIPAPDALSTAFKPKTRLWCHVIGRGQEHLFHFFYTQCAWNFETPAQHSPFGLILAAIRMGLVSPSKRPCLASLISIERKDNGVSFRIGDNTRETVPGIFIASAVGYSLSSDMAAFFIDKGIELFPVQCVRGIVMRDRPEHLVCYSIMGGNIPIDDSEWEMITHTMVKYGAIHCLTHVLEKLPQDAPYRTHVVNHFPVSALYENTTTVDAMCNLMYRHVPSAFTPAVVAKLCWRQNPALVRWLFAQFPWITSADITNAWRAADLPFYWNTSTSIECLSLLWPRLTPGIRTTCILFSHHCMASYRAPTIPLAQFTRLMQLLTPDDVDWTGSLCVHILDLILICTEPMEALAYVSSRADLLAHYTLKHLTTFCDAFIKHTKRIIPPSIRDAIYKYTSDE